MRKYTASQIESLKIDRKRGYSIARLVEKYAIPKTSIWHHVHEVEMEGSLKEVLRSHQGGSKERSLYAWKLAEEHASRFISNVDIEKILPFIFASLYWAEGSKGAFVFTNTDSRMIKIFLKVLRDFFHIGDENLHVLIRINDSMDSRACVDYWHQSTNLPHENIKINVNAQQNRTNSQHGICRITLKKGGAMLKFTHSLISAIVQETEK